MLGRCTKSVIWRLAAVLPILTLGLWLARDHSHAAYTTEILRSAHIDPLLPNLRPKSTPDFQTLESLNYDEVCGLDRQGKTVCHKGREAGTWIPDTVGKLRSALQNEAFGCGQDEDGWKCWRMVAGWSEKLASDKVIRTFLESSLTHTLRLSPTSVCAQDRKTQDLSCLTPSWEAKPKAWQQTAKNGLTAIGVHDKYVCWGDGDQIFCEEEYVRWRVPKTLELLNLKEIKLGDTYLCARSKHEAVCWTGGSGSAATRQTLSSEMTQARQWLTRRDSLCAVTQNGSFICVDPVSGKNIDPNSPGNAIPANYASPQPLLKSVWVSDSHGCALHKDGKVHCWSWWSSTSFEINYSEPVEMLFGSGYSPCGLMQSGQAECRLTYIDGRTLPKSGRVRVEFGGYNKCYWNEGGVDCRGRADAIGFKSVKSVAASTAGESMCVVGVPQDATYGFDTVRCFSYNTEMQAPPFELRSPTTVAVHKDRACAISDEGLTCWGDSFSGVAAPTTIVGARKLRLSDSHGCLIDDFGFACWGDLAGLKLEVPSGLEHPGRVVDFALGSSRTCVVLDSGEVQCWGRDFDSSGPPPTFTKATSIVGRGSLFCALGTTNTGAGLHCWGGYTDLPR